jgi:protein ImuB
VQGLLGPESVLAPVRAGGRSAVDRVTLVPWGDEKVSSRNPADPWPGSIPAPSPTRVGVPQSATGTEKVTVLDESGQPVLLGGRGLLTGSPAWLLQGNGKQHIDAWAGPWLLDERWWAADRRPTGARVQVITESGDALLVRLTTADPARWAIEGVYD